MKLNRPLVAAAYATAALMIVMPLVEVFLSVWPLRFEQTAWRFGTFGLLSQAIMTPVLGAILLVGTALLLAQRRTLLTSSVVAFVLFLVLLVILPLFVLDAIQTRVQVRPTAHRAFDLSGILATIKLTATLVIMLLLAIGAWKAARQYRRTVADSADAMLLGRQRSS